MTAAIASTGTTVKLPASAAALENLLAMKDADRQVQVAKTAGAAKADADGAAAATGAPAAAAAASATPQAQGATVGSVINTSA